MGDLNVTWTVSGTLGVSGSSGANYVFNPAVPGAGTFTATVGGVEDATGVLTVTVGALDDIVIRTGANESGDIVTDLIMTPMKV